MKSTSACWMPVLVAVQSCLKTAAATLCRSAISVFALAAGIRPLRPPHAATSTAVARPTQATTNALIRPCPSVAESVAGIDPGEQARRQCGVAAIAVWRWRLARAARLHGCACSIA